MTEIPAAVRLAAIAWRRSGLSGCGCDFLSTYTTKHATNMRVQKELYTNRTRVNPSIVTKHEQQSQTHHIVNFAEIINSLFMTKKKIHYLYYISSNEVNLVFVI